MSKWLIRTDADRRKKVVFYFVVLSKIQLTKEGKQKCKYLRQNSKIFFFSQNKNQACRSSTNRLNTVQKVRCVSNTNKGAAYSRSWNTSSGFVVCACLLICRSGYLSLLRGWKCKQEKLQTHFTRKLVTHTVTFQLFIQPAIAFRLLFRDVR